VLGKTGRNFAAGMSGGVAYVYDEDLSFEKRCNLAMIRLEKVGAAAGIDHVDLSSSDLPGQRSISVSDAGMGDLLRFDAERIRILVERHLLHTGSPRAKQILDNWDSALSKFIKVLPTDYAKALSDLRARSAIAAE
jgi:glutamate synthase (NADPH/NADH) large chain